MTALFVRIPGLTEKYLLHSLFDGGGVYVDFHDAVVKHVDVDLYTSIILSVDVVVVPVEMHGIFSVLPVLRRGCIHLKGVGARCFSLSYPGYSRCRSWQWMLYNEWRRLSTGTTGI